MRAWVHGLWGGVLAGLALLPAAWGQTPQDLAVKARVTLSLIRFTQWPAATASSTEPLRLCVLHHSADVLAAFRAQEGQQLQGRRLTVTDAPPADAAGCDVLFVHASVARPADHLNDATRRGVLTVGDRDGFADAGGMVELVAVNDAVRFDVNLPGLRAARLGLSSQVLRLARQVRE